MIHNTWMAIYNVYNTNFQLLWGEKSIKSCLYNDYEIGDHLLEVINHTMNCRLNKD